MNNERNSDRFSSYAKILMEGVPGYMRDISSQGFKYVTPVPLTCQSGDIRRITVIPQDGSNETFHLQGEIRWIRKDTEGFQVCGIQITKFDTPQGKSIYSSLQEQFSP